MNAFDRAVQLRREDETTFAAEIPAGWGQGASTFGGLCLGLLAEAIQSRETDPARRIRTLSGEVVAPVKQGAGIVKVRTLRRGKSQTNFSATLEQDGQVVSSASAISSGARGADTPAFAPVPPTIEEAADSPELPVGPPVAGDFSLRYSYRSKGPYPFASGKDPVADGFISERDPRDIWTVAAITAMLDCWWPAFYATVSAPRPAVTAAFTAEYLIDPKTLPANAVFRHRARAIAAHEGFVVELRELWLQEKLVALNQQTFAILR